MSVEISAIIPMFNEADLAAQSVRRIEEQLERVAVSFEVICVDDGSSDGTADVLAGIAAGDERVVPVLLSRNFGKESAMTAGLDAARGEAVILIDADMQHPPELIPEMVQRWREGYDVIEARKSDRGREGLLYRAFSALFYRLIGRASGADLRGSSDFKLLDRQAVDALRSLPERSRFFRGLVGWIGFRRTSIEFAVAERAGGRTSWSTGRLIRYAVGNILSFSTFPLYLTAWIGLITTLLGVGLGAQTLYNYFAGNAVSGFTTVILLVILFAGITLLAVGTVAVYLARALEEIKRRPVYLVRRPRGIDRASSRGVERETEDGTEP
ncbi:MAG: glycosyltransferase family 2 protein [Polyangia bacterium]